MMILIILELYKIHRRYGRRATKQSFKFKTSFRDPTSIINTRYFKLFIIILIYNHLLLKQINKSIKLNRYISILFLYLNFDLICLASIVWHFLVPLSVLKYDKITYMSAMSKIGLQDYHNRHFRPWVNGLSKAACIIMLIT